MVDCTNILLVLHVEVYCAIRLIERLISSVEVSPLVSLDLDEYAAAVRYFAASMLISFLY